MQKNLQIGIKNNRVPDPPSRQHHVWVLKSPRTCDQTVTTWQQRGFHAEAFDFLSLYPKDEEIQRCRRYVRNIPGLLIWTSPSCVDMVFSTMPVAESLQSKCRHIAMGQHTAAQLVAYGCMAETPDHNQAGWDAVLAMLDPTQSGYAVVSGEEGRTQSIRTQLPGYTSFFQIYTRVYKPIDWNQLWSPKHIVLIPGSSEIVQKIFAQASMDQRIALQSVPYISNHPRISRTLKQLGAFGVYDDSLSLWS